MLLLREPHSIVRRAVVQLCILLQPSTSEARSKKWIQISPWPRAAIGADVDSHHRTCKEVNTCILTARVSRRVILFRYMYLHASLIHRSTARYRRESEQLTEPGSTKHYSPFQPSHWGKNGDDVHDLLRTKSATLRLNAPPVSGTPRQNGRTARAVFGPRETESLAP